MELTKEARRRRTTSDAPIACSVRVGILTPLSPAGLVDQLMVSASTVRRASQ